MSRCDIFLCSMCALYLLLLNVVCSSCLSVICFIREWSGYVVIFLCVYLAAVLSMFLVCDFRIELDSIFWDLCGV